MDTNPNPPAHDTDSGDYVSRAILRHEVDDTALEEAMIADLDRALGHPARRHVEAGTVLLQEGEKPSGIAVLIDGQVELTKTTPEGELLVHVASTGRIIGLTSLTRTGRASFTVRATSDATLLPISFAELDRVLREHPALAHRFVHVLVLSLSRRHRRAVELQVENTRLARSLAEDRDRLEQTLTQLEEAQSQVVQSARMATLGELAAGLAHELNNPLAALTRAAEFITSDVTDLLASGPDGGWRMQALERARQQGPMSTAEQRRRRAALAEALGDRDLAERLLAAGIDDVDEARSLLEGLDAAERSALLTELERLHGLGEAMRNLRESADRISGLVQGLRSYARAGRDLVGGVDVREGLDETLRLLAHRLEHVEVVRHYEEVPEITAHPGELNQVWTNIIVNALDAMGQRGRLDVATRPTDGGVEVAITDSGPGIPPENLDRIFEPHFTTKGGRIAYGLGLGLSICRQIVRRHGGQIDIDSQPGRTTVRVQLPPKPPRSIAEGNDHASREDPSR